MYEEPPVNVLVMGRSSREAEPSGFNAGVQSTVIVVILFHTRWKWLWHSWLTQSKPSSISLPGLFMPHCSAFDDPDEEAEQNAAWVSLVTSGSGFCWTAVLYAFCVPGPSQHCTLAPRGSIWTTETMCFPNAKRPLYACLLFLWLQRHYV